MGVLGSNDVQHCQEDHTAYALPCLLPIAHLGVIASPGKWLTCTVPPTVVDVNTNMILQTRPLLRLPVLMHLWWWTRFSMWPVCHSTVSLYATNWGTVCSNTYNNSTIGLDNTGHPAPLKCITEPLPSMTVFPPYTTFGSFLDPDQRRPETLQTRASVLELPWPNHLAFTIGPSSKSPGATVIR